MADHTTTRMSLTIAPETIEALKAAAGGQNITVAEAIRRAIEQWLKGQK